jgi:hypothetical protein
MADYYPLIIKAVAGLDKSTGDSRRALYDRARTALLAQLRGVEPTLSDAEITRERLALEDAIRKVEGEVAFQRPQDARRLRADQPSRPDPVEDQAQDFSDTPIAYAPRAVRSSMGMDDDGTEVEETRQAVPLSAAATTARLPDRGAERWTPGKSLSDNGLRSFRESIGETGPADDGAVRDLRRFEQSPGQWEHDDSGRDEDHSDPEHAHPLARLSPREAPRPPAILADQDNGRGRALQTFPRIVRPERAQVPERAAPQRQSGPSSWSAPRNINRIVAIAVIALLALGIGSVAVWFGDDIINIVARSPRTDSTTSADASRSGKITDRAPTLSGIDATAPQKVVLYEEDPSNPNGTQFTGTAVWRTERLPAATPGQKTEMAVIGEIQIPDQKVSIWLSLRRNDDKQLPMSHTVEIRFTLPPSFLHGGIHGIPGIMMKQGETNRGIALNGLGVKVTDNYFLVGLSQGEGEQRNIQLLKERTWFDIPIVYTDNKRAIVAVEKGPSGERAFSDAFAAWQQ